MWQGRRPRRCAQRHPPRARPAHAELEGFFAQLAETLDQIDFHKGRAPDSAMRKLRRLYLRANLDSADVRLLRGVLADSQRMARLAGAGFDRLKIVRLRPGNRGCRHRPATDAAKPAPALAGLLCLLLACCRRRAAQVAAPADDDASVLVLGRVSDDPKAHYDQLKPLLDYVVPRMAAVGIRSGRILMAQDLQQMTSYLRRGRVDWVNETAGNAGLLERRGAARSFLITERDGAIRYHGVFFVRRDSPVRSLADLVGRSVAFQNPYSTSAYYLPAAQLLDEGMPLEVADVADGQAGSGCGRLPVRADRTQHHHLGPQAAGRCRRVQQPRLGQSAADAALVRAGFPHRRGAPHDVPRALMLPRKGMARAGGGRACARC